MTHFEIHTRAGAALMTFDREDRAREELRRRGLRDARLFRVTRVLEELAR